MNVKEITSFLKYFIFATIITTALIWIYNNKLKKYNNEINQSQKVVEFEYISDRIRDFGRIHRGDSAAYYFSFRNLDSEELVIDYVQTTCGCTVPHWNKEPIKSGTIDSIYVTYDTSKLGEFGKPIFVHFKNDKGTIDFGVKGLVLPIESNVNELEGHPFSFEN